MPAFIKPWTWKSKPPPGSQINRGHPLAQGLMGCFLLNEQGPLLARNLYSNRTYGPNAAFTWESKIQVGYAQVTNAVTEGINDALESFLQFPQRVSILWRGSFNGTPDTNSSIAGALHNNTDSNPYLCYTIWCNSSNNIAFGLNNGSFQQNGGRAITTFTDGLVHNFGLAINTSATGAVNDQSLYSDNAYKECGGAVSGTIGYSANPRLVIGEASVAGRTSRLNSECFYIWDRQLRPSDFSWLWYEPYCMIQPPGPRVSYFKFTSGTSHALSSTAQSASQIIISASNSKPLSAISESQGSIETGMIASYALSSILDSASEVVTLLSHEYNLPSAISESASEITPLLGKLHALVVVSESASQIKALVGKQVALSVKSQSASEAQPSLSRVFTGGLADFDIALQMNPPTAALDTGNRPVAFLFSENDNESSINPNTPNSAPDDSNFFV